MSKSILTMKNLFNKVMTSDQLPLYLEKLKGLKNLKKLRNQKLLETYNKEQTFLKEQIRLYALLKNQSCKSWDIKQIVTKAFNNTNQREGDKN
jgi:hypothetical protein